MSKSHLIISLDFELHWGRFDKYSLESNQSYYKNTREVVPRLLELFERFGIKATWATVGMLMAENREEWEFYKPSVLPSFENERLSAYSWFESEKSIWEKGLFAPGLVREILSYPDQELGSHSFSHYYSMEQGQTLDQWRADLKTARKIALDKFEQELKSLVFPRNQYNEEVIQIASEEGFQIFRTNPKDWFWEHPEKESLIKKVFRTGDTLIQLGEKVSYSLPKKSDGKLLLPASRILRPYRSGSVFNSRRINRIKEEIKTSVKNQEVYHLWWHPHNFGNYPKENLEILERFFLWLQPFFEEGKLLSQSMGGFYPELEKLEQN